MIPHLVYYQLVILVLLWLCVMLPHLWLSPRRGMPWRPADSITPKRRRFSRAQTLCGPDAQSPHCARCEQETGQSALSPSGAARSHASNESPPAYSGYRHALLPPYAL